MDFRKGAEGPAGLVRETMGAAPFSGAVYVFRAKRADACSPSGRRTASWSSRAPVAGIAEVARRLFRRRGQRVREGTPCSRRQASPGSGSRRLRRRSPSRGLVSRADRRPPAVPIVSVEALPRDDRSPCLRPGRRRDELFRLLPTGRRRRRSRFARKPRGLFVPLSPRILQPSLRERISVAERGISWRSR
ncbi:IS66 family insertion sequence element accessory protein TnpB [Pinisolibacter sp. B13]|nr:IS66 family insertion sequence element accessory protein TnpB [Pinisolibacter aquiterrae]